MNTELEVSGPPNPIPVSADSLAFALRQLSLLEQHIKDSHLRTIERLIGAGLPTKQHAEVIGHAVDTGYFATLQELRRMKTGLESILALGDTPHETYTP